MCRARAGARHEAVAAHHTGDPGGAVRLDQFAGPAPVANRTHGTRAGGELPRWQPCAEPRAAAFEGSFNGQAQWVLLAWSLLYRAGEGLERSTGNEVADTTPLQRRTEALSE